MHDVSSVIVFKSNLTKTDVNIPHISYRIHSVECPFSVYIMAIEGLNGRVVSLGGNKANGASSM